MTTTNATTSAWESKRTAETRKVEDVLRNAGLQRVDAYRYNSASIRVRVVDERFEGVSREKRDEMVEPHLAALPESTQADIVTLLTFAPSEVEPGAKALKESLLNLEFDDPSPSML
jgi:acid stress-induced BolA-like protein IbaG/YrbA